MNACTRAALFAAAILIASANDSNANAASTTFDQTPYLRAQHLVDIGGRRLNVYCTGHGLPSVVLEAGGGDDMLDWRLVQPIVAKHTRVCSYDRAGFGFSDPGPLPRDSSASVGDLHALIARGTITRPFVLVGYSTGESYARLYADRYVHDLAALVLIEPAFEGDEEERADLAVPFLAQNAAQQAIMDRACIVGAEPHGLRPRTEAYEACAPQPDPEYPPALDAVILQQYLHPGFWKAFASENDDAGRADIPRRVREDQRNYGDLPLALVTVESELPAGSLRPADQAALQRIVTAGRAPITSYSSRSRHVVARACTHGDVTTRCASTVAAVILRIIGIARADDAFEARRLARG